VGYSRQRHIKGSVENQHTYDYPKAEREDDDEQRSQNRNHHQSKQGNGQPKNDRPFPDVFIDLEPFHLYNDSY
tara:strand:+ start:691 stop:909 length:219 start_codon:yes stop_codon:yes gene_type:complete